MPLVDLQIQPGIYTEQTDRGAVNRWKDGDHVRFRYGLPEKMKGWVRYNDLEVVPPVRAEHDWSSLDNQQWLALASPQKLYVINNDALYDITPIVSSGVLEIPFLTEDGSPNVIVNHVDHGVSVGQFVVFSGANQTGGLDLNGTFSVTSVIDLDNYVITAGSSATFNDAGGGSVSYEYEIPPPDGTSADLGWGIGPYGLDNDPEYVGGGWGTPRRATNLRLELSLWSLDNWGEDLIACRRGGPIYVWERSNGPQTRARIIPNAPVANNWILVSPEDRILIAYGSHDGTQRDQSLIRWCAQENYDDWTPSEGNAAGDKRIDSGSRILTAVRTRNETIIWTDTSIYSQTGSGDNDVFLFQPKGESLSIVGPNGAVEAGGVIYFMARDEFVRYDGTAQILPCTVRNYVFGRIDRAQLEKVYASVNKEQSEVWWFYASNGATDNDSYVIYNYREGTWYYGTIARTCYTDSGFLDTPVAVDAAGAIYRHEVGYSDNSFPLPSFVESYAMEIGDIGDYFGHVDRFIPDFLDLQSSVDVTFEARPYPRGTPISKGPYSVDAETRKVDFRVRGRQISIRIYDGGGDAPEILLWTADAGFPISTQGPTADGFFGLLTSGTSDSNSTGWRFGTLRINARPDGMR